MVLLGFLKSGCFSERSGIVVAPSPSLGATAGPLNLGLKELDILKNAQSLPIPPPFLRGSQNISLRAHSLVRLLLEAPVTSAGRSELS